MKLKNILDVMDFLGIEKVLIETYNHENFCYENVFELNLDKNTWFTEYNTIRESLETFEESEVDSFIINNAYIWFYLNKN